MFKPQEGLNLLTVGIAEAINTLADDIGDISEAKGFWDPDDVGDMGIIPLKLALIHSEATEALDVHRKGYDDSDEDPNLRMTEMQADDFFEEVADIIIRSLDLAGYYGVNIGEIIIAKVEKNRERPYRHSKRY
jgi:NTP pyrophosphatase (non-canonical NTP hydrolase)